VEIVKGGIPGSRVFKTFPARTEFFQSILPRRLPHAMGLESIPAEPRKRKSAVK
jgi:hypothetical protein